MDTIKLNAIQQIVDSNIKSFADGLELRYKRDLDNPSGNINSKMNNCFIAQLGDEFVFYSAFVRSFDSSFGKVFENMGNAIAKLSYEVRGSIDSFILPQQSQHIDYLMTEYNKRTTPNITDYKSFNCIIPKDITSYKAIHKTDNYFYDKTSNEHHVVELKSGGDLDTKKAKAEKVELLRQYYLLKNSLAEHSKINLYLGTAYNKFGEDVEWKQDRVTQYFAKDELLIGKKYWNFVCNDSAGFDIIFEQYKTSANFIKDALEKIKSLYLGEKAHG